MQSVSLKEFSELIILSAIWGSSFLFLRLATPVFGPIFLIEMRVLSGLIVLLPLVLLLGKFKEFKSNWKMIATVSLMNMAVPFASLHFPHFTLERVFSPSLTQLFQCSLRLWRILIMEKSCRSIAFWG